MGVPGPLSLLIGLAVLGLLGLVLRWAFGGDPDRRRDYGLLREVARVPSARAAEVVAGRLAEVGIRATSVPGQGDGYRVLVFPADEREAISTLLR